jgi:hypothetical protein
MKRWFVIFALASLLPAWHDAAAAEATSREPGSSGARQGRGDVIQRFVDEDGDGLNDLVADSDGDGIPNENGFGHAGFGSSRPAQGEGGVPASGSAPDSRKSKGGGR